MRAESRCGFSLFPLKVGRTRDRDWSSFVKSTSNIARPYAVISRAGICSKLIPLTYNEDKVSLLLYYAKGGTYNILLVMFSHSTRCSLGADQSH
jgi:hypothetical protein